MGSSISSATAARPSSSGVSGMGSMSADSSSSSSSSSSGALYSSNADDKTLRETYHWSFYDAVHSGLGGVMCAMTQVNNTLSCESS
jgi:beta-glucosidase